MALGVSPTTLTAATCFSEFYDPAIDSWSLGPNPLYLRTQPEAAMLLDGRVLSFGGTYSGSASSKPITRSAGQVPDCTQVADLYDPARNVWRPLANLKRFVHYHSVTLVVPDGRVINFGGGRAAVRCSVMTVLLKPTSRRTCSAVCVRGSTRFPRTTSCRVAA